MFPKWWLNTFNQLSTCLGFLSWLPTWAVITPLGFNILIIESMFLAARSMQNCSSFKSTSEEIGTLTYLKEPDDVEPEWVEDCLIPKSYYSRPIPGGGNFVRGCERYTIPVDPRKKKEGSRRTPRLQDSSACPGLLLDIESLRRVQLAKQEERLRQQETSSIESTLTWSPLNSVFVIWKNYQDIIGSFLQLSSLHSLLILHSRYLITMPKYLVWGYSALYLY